MRAIDTCEWLPGEFFLIYWVDAVMASTVVHSIEISAMLTSSWSRSTSNCPQSRRDRERVYWTMVSGGRRLVWRGQRL
jgi:hypothetical protein